ncbi:MAG: alpha/beta fold hydrolase [Acidobacteriota bacterium]
MIIDCNGIALNCLDEGQGEPVVLLHGHSLDLRVWDDVVPELLHAGFRTIRYDQRGHGRSSSPTQGYRWGDHAADLAAVIERLEAAPAHVLALSKGGGIALELALRRPELVASLALVGPLVPDFALSSELVGSFREFARAIRTTGVAAAVRSAWLGHPLIASAAALPGAREKLEAMLLTFPAGEYLATARDEPDRDWKLTARLAQIVAPVLVASGDREVPDFAAMARLVAEKVPGARLEVIRECGHLVPLERPGELGSLVVAFLRGEVPHRP